MWRSAFPSQSLLFLSPLPFPLSSRSPSHPFPFPSPVFFFPFPSPLEAGPLNPVRGLTERCKLPQWGLGRGGAEIEFSAF